MIDLTEQIRDRYEKRLRKILKINRYLEYNKDINLGQIGAWILKSPKGIDSAIKLLIEKALAIYIHQQHGSAVVFWDYIDNEFVIQTWFNQKMESNERTKNADVVKAKLLDAWKYCRTKKGTKNDL